MKAMSATVVDMMELAGPLAVTLTVATVALVAASLDRNNTFIMKLYVAFIAECDLSEIISAACLAW